MGIVVIGLSLGALNAASIRVLSVFQYWNESQSRVAHAVQAAGTSLYRYADTGNPAHYAKYLQAMRVPLLSIEVRAELDKPEPDLSLVIRRLEEAGFSSTSTTVGVRAHHYFSYLPAVQSVDALWRQSNIEFERLQRVGDQVHADHGAGKLDVDGAHAELEAIEASVERLAVPFRQTLQFASERMRRILGGFSLFFSTGLLLLIGLMSWRSLRQQEHESQRTRDELDERDQLYRAVLQNTPDAIYVFDPHTLCVVETNAAFRQLLGFDGDERGVAHLHDFVDQPPEEIAAVVQEVRRQPLLATPSKWRHRDGHTIVIEITAAGVKPDADGEAELICVIGRDLTAQRELNARLIEVDRLASMGNLATAVGHEINNPLAFITANIEFAWRSLLDERALIARLSEAAKLVDPVSNVVAELGIKRDTIIEALHDAVAGAARVRDVVRDLNTFTHWKVTESWIPVELEKVLDSAISIANNQIRHRATLVKDYAGGFYVEGTETRIAQVFLNLIVNAAQAIPSGDAAQNEIRVAAEIDGDFVVVSVSDTGVGMAPAVLERIYEPFMTTRAGNGGSGLGLPISKNIVESLGGRIEVQSEPGQGTCFRVWLCRAIPEIEAVAAIAVEAPRSTVARILVVDDEQRMGRAVQRTLGKSVTVVHETSAQDGLIRLETDEAFDLILCDLMMPHMNGVVFYGALASRQPELCERVIFISGGVFSDDVRQWLETHDIEVLEKPFDREKICRRVREAVESLERDANPAVHPE
ncbi:MAG: response regulator [Bradymonadaceae bacterium]|nr:response regulator [Lujinxingiaceae bacterium]